jgi:hypothetical protein
MFHTITHNSEINKREKGYRKQNCMDAHPFLITHHLGVVLQAVADPNQTDKQKYAVNP